MRSTTTKAFAGVAVLALALAGCGSNSGSSTKSADSNAKLSYSINEQAATNLKDGGNLNLSIEEITPQLNMFQANMTVDTSTLWNWYNPQLIKFTPSGDMKLDKNYLESVNSELKDGKTVVTYKINDKAKFNDGTDLDWTAFQATWQANSGKEQEYNANTIDGYDQIDSVKAGDNAKTVVVSFAGPYPWYSSLFNNVLHPAVNSADIFNNGYTGGTLASAHPEWGAGPYALTGFDANAGVVTFERNPNWWGDKGKLDKITYTVRADVQAQVNAYKNGEADTVETSTSELLTQVTSVADTDIRRGTRAANYLLTMNSKSELLSDTAVRKAIATGINRAQLQQVLFQGLDYSEAIGGSLTLYPFQKGYQDNLSKVVAKTDTAAATKALEEAGYAKGSDGTYAKDGKALSLRLPLFSSSTTSKAMYQAFQTQMKAVGIDVQIIQKSSKDFSTTVKNRDFDLLISGWASTDPNGVAFFCQKFCSDSTLNKSGTGTAELDNLIKGPGGLTSLQTAEDQESKANELEVQALGTFGILPIYNGPEIFAVKKGLANVGAGVYATTRAQIGDFPENIGWQKD
ncbi:Oligopeptide-binding protein OppA [Propionibacterium freudenreichii]|uniref:ABC transporter family substrate-binding protein n=1 Tax=Propionibacterium freudenreichii TaxID=1744 RepID=UPI00049F9896|nr:ABC transporter family substrate-binding protein [Propionibacterium freudenreichii]AWY96263.1 Oligopeptide-binding protein OppA [Propionibacterium freudenreichii]CDP47931.1 solute binding protein of the ABC transport system [Propionibacterium freudenreichii subsp. freudenreichii]